MNWRQKIRALLKDKNASELSRTVGLNPSAIGAAVSKGNLPKADKAVKIAKALGVSADWLFDDDQDWPPPIEPSLADVPQRELVGEVARRRELIRRDMRAIAAAFTDERLIHLDRLSAFGVRNEAQQAELDSAVQSLYVCEMLARHLLWLEPDEVHPPPSPARSGTELAAPFENLATKLNEFFANQRGKSIGTPAMGRHGGQAARDAVPRYDLNGQTFPQPPETTVELFTEVVKGPVNRKELGRSRHKRKPKPASADPETPP